jgi:hypothetical protein
MHRLLLALTTTAAVLTAGAVVPSSAAATPLGARLSLDGMNPIQNVAICFYVDGWNGPGLYDCGYRHRRGFGWHGRREGHNNPGHMNDRGRAGDQNGRHDSGTEGRGRR